jgi:hypothetical protein
MVAANTTTLLQRSELIDARRHLGYLYMGFPAEADVRARIAGEARPWAQRLLRRLAATLAAQPWLSLGFDHEPTAEELRAYVAEDNHVAGRPLWRYALAQSLLDSGRLAA